ncbi:MAG: arginine--tRNA ligase [Candidatus Shikimatogenerans bostrichidophilus]|nr:MAG: arginine--tRNA ligase [Candidatus Shikimatogenerans bostrichidophilus]
MKDLIEQLKDIYIKKFCKYNKEQRNNINILYNNYKDNSIYGDINININSIFFLKKKNKNKLGIKLGNKIKKKLKKYVYKYELKSNYLNIFLKKKYYINKIKKFIKSNFNIQKTIYNKKNKKKRYIIEFSSPNSNKPLHLGHLRNILIGNTIANIYNVIGFNVIKSQLINDRGIHICKSIIAFKKFFNKKIKLNIKGDHFVGILYFKFEKEFQKEIKLISKKYNIKKNQAIKYSRLSKLVNNELINWEKKKGESISIWKKINKLVYKGFSITYKKLNVKFDDILYESKTYLLGKNFILEGLKKKIFFLDKDKSVYFLYKKKKIILLRNNGTSLYITQEIGTLLYRIKKYKKFNLLIYVVGNEQINHFKVLFEIIKINKLLIYNKLYHLSYNTVNFLGKKIKSRYIKKNEFIFIDDLICIMNNYVKHKIKKKKSDKIVEQISLGAIKYQFIKINPKKKIDFNINNVLKIKGNTGIYIQYTYARIYSILKKNNLKKIKFYKTNFLKLIKKNEISIIRLILEYKTIIDRIIKKYDPSILTNYIYIISKKINNFYQKNKILNIKNIYKRNLRLIICKIILNFLYFNMKILGIPILKKI